MKLHLIFARWPKLPEQTPFTLPPLGMIQAAACVPEGVTVTAVDENVSPVDMEVDADLIGFSILLSCQATRAYELADAFRAKGKTVILGGVHVTLTPEESGRHADAIVVGEAEGTLPVLIRDFQGGTLKKVYRPADFSDMRSVPNPRRDLYDKQQHYSYKGWELSDLLETSRGCRFNCSACCIPFLDTHKHRTRPIDDVLKDVESAADMIYLVDNSLDQNPKYQRELLPALKGTGKRWISHPVSLKPDILNAAREAGWLYVYHAIWAKSNLIRDRVKMYKDHGIAVQGSIALGLDHQDEDYIKEFFDFLVEIGLDLAEFTIITPFPSSRLWNQWEAEGRIFDRDWSHYNAANVVFRPKHMTPERLQELYFEGWKHFYGKETRVFRMSKLHLEVVETSAKRRRPRAERVTKP